MPTPRASINQQVQLGVESVPGTSVAANKLLNAFTWTFGLKPTTKQFRGTGRQYPSASAVLYEMSTGKIAGPFDFAQMNFPASSLWGAPTANLHSGASTVYDNVWTPPIVGSYAANAKTYTVQQGDTVDAEQYAFLVFTGMGYSFTRKQELQASGDFMAQTFSDGITMTSSPTPVAQIPSVGAQYSLYLDSTSGGIGTTQLLDPLKVDFKASDYYDGYWPINRSSSSYTNIIDKEKKHELSLLLQANSTGIAMRGNYLETGQRCYVRVAGQGQLIENDQTVGVGAASGGTFTLTYKGQTTSGIAYNATAATVQSALRGLSTIGSTGCSVSGTAPNWTILFTGALAQDTTLLTGNGSGLTGGALSIAAAPVYAAMQHDMCLFVADMDEFSDQDGAYAVGYKLIIAEDTGWGSGKAQVFTLSSTQNGLA